MIKTERIAEELRQEPYHILPMKYNCVGKSFRFKQRCFNNNIKARVVICLGVITTKRFGFLMRILMIHGWGEVNNKRIEVARPLGEKSPWGTFDIDLRPIFAIWI